MKPSSFLPSFSIFILLILLALSSGTGSVYGAWQLVWSDEFNLPDGSSPDPNNWGYDIGNGQNGWGNSQLEYDTSRTNNVRIQGGQLVIQANLENYTNGANVYSYTSTRMNTKGKASWRYGRIEARIKLPRGQGIWPAFWMLGTNNGAGVSWPSCGEIDIMENIGKATDQGTDHGTIHGPQNGHDYNNGSGVGGTTTIGGALADNFHIYAVEWSTNQIKWYLDNTLFFTATPALLPSGSTWVFTNSQFIILNVAVGGQWPGNPDGSTVFPQQMLVDYVRVYTSVAGPPDMPTGLTVGAGNSAAYLSWNASTGAGSYNVKRSAVSGGPYATVTNTASTSYTDTGLSTCSTYYYVVSATNSIAESTNSSESAVSLGAFAMAVNSGGSAASQFAADSSFSGGAQASPVTATIDTSAVTAPAPQAVYQTERYGNNFTYTFSNLTQVANYKVRLHFSENYWTAPGQRVFNVSINGNQVLTNYDIIAATGAAKKANIQEFMTTPTSTNTIVVKYTTVTDNAKSSGIEILIPTPSAPTGLMATASDSLVTLSWNATSGAATYDVRRSLSSNGPYTLIASGLTDTNAADLFVTNRTTYYYVVSAVNGCESGNSTQVSATPICTPPLAPIAGNNGPIWAGTTLNLTASTVPGATYSWTGPNGFTSTDQNPWIANATTDASGIYSVTATVGSCASLAGTTTAVVNQPSSITYQWDRTTLTLSWPGNATLQTATDVFGPWSDLTDATNPYAISPAEPQRFFRLKLQ